VIRRLARWVDDRLGGARFARTALDKIFPDHWSFMLGEIGLYCFVMLVVTGTYLMFFFDPSTEEVVHRGSYESLRGVPMSAAYDSVLRISFDVRAGLVMRQIHHWAALVFVAALLAHLCRVFFTGAFRRPREINWVIGVGLLLLVIFNGFTGYSLPDDQLSGTGLRIAYSVALSVPVLGTWAAFLVFGGEFPTTDIISRLYAIHIMLVPGAIVALLTAHMAILWRQKHTQFPGPGRTETNIVGSRLWPTYAAKATGLFFGVSAVLCALGGLAQINPVWLYGPFRPEQVSAGSQPDWYLGWLEGALRLFPGWEIRAFDHTVANPFFPAVLLPGITFGLLFAWPWLEAYRTGDWAPHHVLDRPRDRATRTALGAATLTFYVILFMAGGNDILASLFHISVNAVTWVFRVALFVLPPVVGLFTHRLCHELAASEARPMGGGEGHVVQRTPAGGYAEVERSASA
jgi:ubiquinol-cytochrome c reductase cytochrome b subunit